MKIYRYELEITDRQTVCMPAVGKVLSVASRGEHSDPLHMWALVDPDSHVIFREFAIYGTGGPIESDTVDQTFIGTCIQSDLVWHVFEVIR